MDVVYLTYEGVPAVIIGDKGYLYLRGPRQWVERNEADIGWKGRVISEEEFREWLWEDYGTRDIPKPAGHSR